MDIGRITIKDFLESKLGTERTEVVLKIINKAYEQGLRGEDLTSQFKTALREVDYDISQDPDKMPFGFVKI